MKDSTLLGLAGIASLTLIGALCIMKGIDHAIIFTIATVIGGICGYELKARRK